MRFTSRQNLKFASVLPAQSYAVGAQNSTSIDFSQFGSASFRINAGTFGASATLDAKLQFSNDNATWTDVTVGASGNHPFGIPVAAITQLLAAGGVQSAQLDIDDAAYRYYRVVGTVGTAAVVFGIEAIQSGARNHPANVALT